MTGTLQRASEDTISMSQLKAGRGETIWISVIALPSVDNLLIPHKTPPLARD